MGRHITLAYGIAVYIFFLGTFLRAMAFVTGLPFSRGLDEAPFASGSGDWALDLGLLGLFALQHMVMARRGFKRLLTRILPEAAERSTFVLATCLVLNLLIERWRALPGALWDIEEPWARGLLTGLSLAGWGTVLVTTFLIDHFELFGLAQVWRKARGVQPAPKAFVTPSLYRVSRHPMYLGFFIAFWATPTMSFGHLLFAGITTAWVIFEVIVFEEPDLVRDFGNRYRDYQQRVGMFLPRPSGRPAAKGAAEGAEVHA